MRRFEYIRVDSMVKAGETLAQYGVKAHILAGGTDVLVKMKQKQMAPEVLVDIKAIPGLSGIRYEDGQGMWIGPLTTIREIEMSPTIKERLPVLGEAAHALGSVQIRHRATIGGNLCNALPSADMGPYLVGMGARVKVAGPQGEQRSLLVEDLFAASGQNSLDLGEVVTAIEIPKWSSYTGGAYIKHAIKNAVDVAIVSVAVVVVIDPIKKVLREGKIVLGAVGPRPIRPKRAEELLRGEVVQEKLIGRVGELASMEAKPRTMPEYKTEMVKVLTMRALRQALASIHTR